MKLTKKLSVILLVLALISTMTLATDKITVWLTGHNNEEMGIIKDVTEASFTAKTGIAVEYTNLSWGDFETRFLLAAASGEAPDVGGAGALFIPELGLRGAMMDLSKMPGFNEVYNRAYPGFYRSLQYQNITFGVPYSATVSTAFQRDDILKDLGIKSINTWDELKQVLPKMQAKNTNFALQWYLTETLYADVNMFMWQRGADDYNADLTKSGYDDPQCIIAFKDFVEFYTKYKIPKELPHHQAFVSGDLALLIQYPNFYQNLIHAAPQIAGKWSMVQAPGYNIGGKINRTTTGGGSALGIFNASKKKNQAWEFIKWITDESVQLEFSKRIMDQIKGSMFLPSNRGAISKISIDAKAAEVFNTALNTSKSSIYGLVAPKHRRRYLQMAAQRCILEGEDPEKSIRKAADEHNEELRRKQVEYNRYIKELLKKK